MRPSTSCYQLEDAFGDLTHSMILRRLKADGVPRMAEAEKKRKEDQEQNIRLPQARAA